MVDLGKELVHIGSSVSQSSEQRMIEVGCRSVGLLTEEEQFIDLVECSPWTRGGAETYITTGIVHYRSNKGELGCRKVIAKAYAGMGLGIPPEERVRCWQERASILAKAGISVSKVYGTHTGVLYAQYIESSLVDYLRAALGPSTIRWATQLLFELAKALDSLRADAISLLPDLRTDRKKIYLVDFGEDLGGIPGTSKDAFYCRNLLRQELINYRFERIAWNLYQ
jgi:hypothetical protein